MEAKEALPLLPPTERARVSAYQELLRGRILSKGAKAGQA
jgi:hypothetical protein